MKTKIKTENCIFCQIIKGKIPCHKIHEDKNYLAFLDVSRFVEGHTLVVPKKHIRYVWDSREIGMFYSFVKDVANHFRSLGFAYVDSLTFGRLVEHAHVHLIPHNNKINDYIDVLRGLGVMQQDKERRLNRAEGLRIAQKFGF